MDGVGRSSHTDLRHEPGRLFSPSQPAGGRGGRIFLGPDMVVGSQEGFSMAPLGLRGCCFALLVLPSTWTPTVLRLVQSCYSLPKRAQADLFLLYSVPHFVFPPIRSNFKDYFPHSQHISEHKTSLSSPALSLQLGSGTALSPATLSMVLPNTEELQEAGADPLGFG